MSLRRLDEILDSEEISSLSDAQDKTLSILPFFPAMLSIFGSSTIIYLVFKARFKTPYKRILFGTSVCDIFASITYAMSAFLLPEDTSQRAFASGNDASCSALGAFIQFSYSTFFYQGFLSYYYLSTIRFGVREEIFAKRFEKLGHSIAIGYPLLTAIAGLIVGVYNEVELGHFCWVKDYPEGCGDDEGDTESCKSPMIAWIFGGIPVMIVILSVIINNVVIYLFVRSTITRARRRSSFGSQSANEKKRIREVAIQAFLYVAAFLVTYIWTIVLRIMESLSFDSEDESSLFWLLLLQALISPMVGFLNLCVYSRPRYLRCRNEFPFESRLWCYRRALYGNSTEPTKSRQPNTTLSSTDEPGSMSNPTSSAFMISNQRVSFVAQESADTVGETAPKETSASETLNKEAP